MAARPNWREMTSPERESARTSGTTTSERRTESPDRTLNNDPFSDIPSTLSEAQELRDQYAQQLISAQSSDNLTDEEIDEIDRKSTWADRNFELLETAETLRTGNESSAESDAAWQASHTNLKTLSEVMPKEQWWRIYIKPEDHAAAVEWAREKGEDVSPGLYYDEKYPNTHKGFHQSMEAACEERLNNREALAKFKPDYENHLITKEVVNRHLATKIAETGDLTDADGNELGRTGHGSNNGRNSHTLLAKKLGDRPLHSTEIADTSEMKNADSDAITMRVFTSTQIASNYTKEESKNIGDAIGALYEKELVKARVTGDPHDVAAAIGDATRLKVFVHLSKD